MSKLESSFSMDIVGTLPAYGIPKRSMMPTGSVAGFLKKVFVESPVKLAGAMYKWNADPRVDATVSSTVFVLHNNP